MPMFDNLLTLSYNQSLAGVASTTAYGQNELDFEQANADKGSGSPLVVRFVVTTSFTVATGVQFALCFDTTSQAPSPSATAVVETVSIPIATLIQGYSFELKIPDEHAQYMNVAYITNGTPGAGKITAYVDIATGLRHR